jgi:hypothetical protein
MLEWVDWWICLLEFTVDFILLVFSKLDDRLLVKDIFNYLVINFFENVRVFKGLALKRCVDAKAYYRVFLYFFKLLLCYS